MQLRFSGRLNFTQAIPSLTVQATVSASVRSVTVVSTMFEFDELLYSISVAIVMQYSSYDCDAM
jgi:hypothetical protein